MTYQLQLKRKGIIIYETFTGSKLEFMLYRFKNRKWEISVIA